LEKRLFGQLIWRIPKKLKIEVADSIRRKYVPIELRCQLKDAFEPTPYFPISYSGFGTPINQ